MNKKIAFFILYGFAGCLTLFISLFHYGWYGWSKFVLMAFIIASYYLYLAFKQSSINNYTGASLLFWYIYVLSYIKMGNAPQVEFLAYIKIFSFAKVALVLLLILIAGLIKRLLKK